MAKPNFSFQKRQKELARQKKKEEKKQRKLEKTGSTSGENEDAVLEESTGEQAPGAAERGGSEQ